MNRGGPAGMLLGSIALEPVPLRPRNLLLEPRQFRLRAIGTDPCPPVFAVREPSHFDYLRTIDEEDPDLDVWVRTLFARLNRPPRD